MHNNTFKYRIYPSKEQQKLLFHMFNCARFVYNQYVCIEKNHYESFKNSTQNIPEKDLKQYMKDNNVSKYISLFDVISNYITPLKSQHSWLNKCHSQVLQQSCKHADNAFQRFFNPAIDSKFPKYKKKNVGVQSISFPQYVSLDFDKKFVKIPKIGKIKTVFHRRFDLETNKIKTCTISRVPSGKFYISILVENNDSYPEFQYSNLMPTIGIDLGIKNYLTLSTGEIIPNPKTLELRIFRRS